MTHYGILGGGEHPANIIEDGLRDLYHDDPENTLLIHCRTGASPSEKRVYSWVLDNQIPFVAVVKESGPKVLVEAADYITHADECDVAIIKELAANNGTLLILWDEAKGDYLGYLINMADGLGVECKELSNGLTPFYVADSLDKAIPASEALQELPVTIQEVEVDPFENDGDDAIVASDTHTPSPDLFSGISEGQLNWVENGRIYTIPLGPEFTKKFLADLRYEPGKSIL